MSTRKTSVFYAVLIAVASIAVGMVIASRLDLTPASSAQAVSIPPMNSAPLAGAIDAATFRNIAKTQIPTVVNIRTESRQRTQDLTEFFGGGGGGGEDLLRRFFGGGGQPAPNAPQDGCWYRALSPSRAMARPKPPPRSPAHCAKWRIGWSSTKW